MMVLDLKSLIFLGLLLLAGCTWLGVWVGKRLSRPTPWRSGRSFQGEMLALIEQAPYGFVLLDTQTRGCLFANAYACQWLGILPGETRIPDSPWKKEIDQDLDRLACNAAPETCYRTLTLPNEQTLNWWVCASPQVALIILADWSNQRKAEKTARLFLSNLSHELRSPLTAVLSHVEVLRAADIPEAARQNSLLLIREAAERITRLVQDLLELSRLEVSSEFDPVPVDLLLVTEGAISEIILPAEERQILISLEADLGLARVLGEPDRLKQAFINLLDNAAKYSRPGDRVTVRLADQPQGVLVTIRDTGPGIPAEHLPHVTQRLYRVNKDIPGSGIGLALVEEILRRHHAHLDIESQTSGEHTGTSIRFVLPKISST